MASRRLDRCRHGIAVLAIVEAWKALFTSKKEKIRKATEKMRSQLVAEIDKGMKKSQQDFLENVDTAVGKYRLHISQSSFQPI